MYCSIYSWHFEGGVYFMFPLLFMLMINLGLIAYVALSHVLKKSINPMWLEAIRQLGGFALAWGAFWTLAGLLMAFDSIESSKEMIPMNVIAGGMKVVLLTVLYGFFIFLVSMFAYIILRLLMKKTAS